MEKLKVNNLSNKEIKLPSNLEAEQALIGSILVNNDIIDEVSNIVNRNEFYDPIHSKIYSLIENLHNKGMIANPITLKNSLQKDFYKHWEGYEHAPFPEDMDSMQKIQVMELAIKRSVRYKRLKYQKKSDEEIDKIFNTKTEMQLLSSS